VRAISASFWPWSLAGRFALAAAGLAAAALLLTSIASWWLINSEHRAALAQLRDHERRFHAAAVGSQLQALATRMSEVAASTILATGLVDSAGRETYLAPFLAGIRQVNGVPVQVLFTDFEGKEIATNGNARFTTAEREWLGRQLEIGRSSAAIFANASDFDLVAVEPMTYSRTKSPEGALLYKISLSDLHIGNAMRLEWGAPTAAANPELGEAVDVPPPRIFESLHFRVRGPALSALATARLEPQYIAIFVVALILFVAVVATGVWLAKLLTHDLHRLQAFASRIISGGLGVERAPIAGSAEVTSLALSVNQMLDRLHEQRADLMHEREKLTDLAGALQAADRRKDEFLATLAHELRNPLAPIANSLEILKRASGDAALAARSHTIMERQVRQLVRLVDDLLDVSRITRGRLELRKESVALSSVIDQAVESCRTQLDAAGHKLRVSHPAEAIVVDADPVRLTQVLSNLLSNAVKYTPPGGRIVVESAVVGAHAEIKVQDTGAGIAPEMIERVFEMFIRADSSLEHTQSGLGIGLTLAKRLVELHDGTLSARSEGIGRGSTFVVQLPLATVQQVSAPVEAIAPSIGGRRVLVVDDNRDAAASLAELLQQTGNETRTAHDGAEAIIAAAEYQPDVIMLDIGLPKKNGYDVCRAIRETLWGKDIFIVALTGWGQDQDRRRSREAGFDAHLVKPADYAQLAQLLAEPASAAQSGI
jgi:signal transduction histidine kinase/ActR/RegA family two-component response regulator